MLQLCAASALGFMAGSAGLRHPCQCEAVPAAFCAAKSYEHSSLAQGNYASYTGQIQHTFLTMLWCRVKASRDADSSVTVVYQLTSIAKGDQHYGMVQSSCIQICKSECESSAECLALPKLISTMVSCRVRTLIQSGMVGRVHHFHGAFIAEMPEDIERIYDPAMGGGALLDIGIYPLSIASWVFGRQTPKVVSAMGMVHPRGVDNLGMVNLK